MAEPELSSAPMLVPWGDGGDLPLGLPSDWRVADVCWPDLDGAMDGAAYASALSAALDGLSPPLDDRVRAGYRPGQTVAIVVDDPSRWTPSRQGLSELLPRLERAGIQDRDIEICVAVGRHKPVDEAVIRSRLGDAIVDRYRWHSPPVDHRAAYAELGTTSRGIPVRVFQPVARAVSRILVGSVLPHMQAGFGGGWKLVFPGVSHRSTLVAVHRQGLSETNDGPGPAAQPLGGDSAGNPMRQAIREAAALLPGETISISHLLGSPGQVLRVLAGDPDPVQDQLAHEARRRFQAAFRPPADVIVVGNSPWPGDPLQSFKALIHHRDACRPGGVLVGLFWADPREVERSMPESTLRLIASTGAVGDWAIRRGLSTARRLALTFRMSNSFMIHWAKELVLDRQVLVYCPPLVERIGTRLGPVRLFDDQSKLWAAARRALAGTMDRARRVRVRIFPQGGLTYCRQHATRPED